MMGIIIRSFLLLICLGAAAHAASPALFGKVVNVAGRHALSVRARPGCHSRKLGTFPNGAHVYIDQCRRIGRSRWCRIHPDPLVDYGGTAGWVNAKSIQESNYGYVRIKGRENGCYVSLKCRGEDCLVVTRLSGEETVTGLHTEWIARSRLIGANKFSAMKYGDTGYCVSLHYVNDYLGKQRLRSMCEIDRDPAFDAAVRMVNALYDKNLSAIISLIHPAKGIRLSEMAGFGTDDDRLFTRQLFKTYWKNSQQIDWGHTYGRGDIIRKDLWHYVDTLSLSPGSINKVAKLDKRLRGFPAKGFDALTGYSFCHTDPHSSAQYDWQGIIIVLAPYKGQWYVAGMLRERWTI